MRSRVILNVEWIWLLLLFPFTAVGAETGSDSDLYNCQVHGFQNTYYFVESPSIEKVSEYYQHIASKVDFLGGVIIKTKVGNRNFKETFYDDEALSLLSVNKALFMSEYYNLPDYRMGSKQVFLIDSSAPNPVQKYEIKEYNKKTSPLDKHELFGRIKRKQRSLLIDQFKADLKFPIVSITKNFVVDRQQTVRLYQIWGKSYGEISLESFQILGPWLPKTFTLLSFKVYEDAKDGLSNREFNFINKMFCEENNKLALLVPEISPLKEFGYSQYNQLANRLFPMRHFFNRNLLLFHLGQVLVLALIGFLLIYLLLGRYKKRHNYRSIVINDQNE